MKVLNTLSGRKEEFQPNGNEVKMYVCGVTPYDHAHMGHAMSYIIFDVIRRYLEHKGYRVRHVQNFTDVDDKIIDRAQRLGIPATQLAETYAQELFLDLDALNVQRAHVYPRVTQEIPDIIQLVQTLIDKNHAYSAGGDVYFRVNSSTNYGELAHRALEGMLSGARIEVEDSKENPMDFALWKAAKPDEPAWESPWGLGRPGWHIECSAMALRYLGEQLDIHGGGQDLIFPHHENEIAQSEAATGQRPFVKYWLHNGLLRLGEDKMSKSLGNLVTVKDALERYSPDAIRLFVLSSHYRSPLTYTEEGLASWERGAERLREAYHAPLRPEGLESAVDVAPYRQHFFDAMDDDFNTAQAVAVLFDLAREINRGREEGLDVGHVQETLGELAQVLGLTLTGKEDRHMNNSAPLIDLLISVRADLRAAKHYSLADKIRSELESIGILLEDTSDGTVWKVK